MRWSLPPWPGAHLAHPEPTCSSPGPSGAPPPGRATCRGSCVPPATSWFPGCSSWAPPWPPFQLLFSLHALPCVSGPALDFCPVSIVMSSEGDLKRCVSDDVTLDLKTPPWPSTALSIKTNQHLLRGPNRFYIAWVLPACFPPSSHTVLNLLYWLSHLFKKETVLPLSPELSICCLLSLQPL